MHFLSDDVARCRGVFDQDDGEIYWREGCEYCLRRLAPNNGDRVVNMDPPLIIVFECEFLIENNARNQGHTPQGEPHE